MKFDIRGYLESRLDRAIPSAGSEMTAVCPVCGKWSSFYANCDNGAYVCFACDFRGGSVVGLVAEVEGLTHSRAAAYVFRRSVEFRRSGPILTLLERLQSLRGGDRAEEPDVDIPLPDEFIPVWRRGEWSLPPYLAARRIKAETARRWGLGYARRGRYWGRLIVPIKCPNGRSFTARDVFDDRDPKYLNPRHSDHNRMLIGWDVVNTRGDLTLVEGPIDTVKLDQYGIPALGVGGKVLHTKQLELLFALSPDQAVTVMLDPEERIPPYSMAEALSVHFRRVYIARLPMGIDPGEASRSRAHSAYDNAERFTGDRRSRLRRTVSNIEWTL